MAIAYYFQWGLTTSYGNNTTSTIAGTGTSAASVNSAISGLTADTTYHCRIVATNSAGTAYGSDLTFTTPTPSTPVAPTVTTTAASSITQTTATSGGNVTSDGGASVTARGVCWSTSANPTTANSHTTDGTGTGVFTSSLTGLTAGTIYHIRAYATNSVNTSYGSDLTFTTTTPTPVAPTVTTSQPGYVTQTTAQIKGKVNPNGDSTTYYFQWGATTSYGNTTSSTIISGSSEWLVAKVISGLSEGSTYHYRLVATNGGGTSYGSDVAFYTIPPTPTLYSPADGATSIPRSVTLDWSDCTLATQYNIQVDNNSDFSSPIVNIYVTSSSYALSGLSYFTKYYWRVCSHNGWGGSPSANCGGQARRSLSRT